jgi:hypothetical protein
MSLAKEPTTIILIGGLITLSDGSTIDSRQLPYTYPSMRVHTNCWSWWETVISIVNPLLQGFGQKDFETQIGDHSLAEIKDCPLWTMEFSNGKPRRRNLETLLRSSIPTIRPIIEGPYRIALAKYSRLNQLLLSSNPDIEYYPQRSPKYKRDVRIQIRSYYNQDIRGFDSAQIIILPHNQFSEHRWNRQNQHPQTKASPNSDLFTEDGDFSITGLVKGGKWCDPCYLEAARRYLEHNEDIKFPIWDLATNEDFRDLLDPFLVAT